MIIPGIFLKSLSVGVLAMACVACSDGDSSSDAPAEGAGLCAQSRIA